MDHMIQISKLKSQLEQQRQQLQEEHHREMNTVMEKVFCTSKAILRGEGARYFNNIVARGHATLTQTVYRGILLCVK